MFDNNLRAKYKESWKYLLDLGTLFNCNSCPVSTSLGDESSTSLGTM